MSGRYSWRLGIVEGVMAVVAVVFALPLVIMVVLAFRPQSDSSSVFSLSSSVTLDNFVDAWTRADLGSAIVNSLILTVSSVVLIVVLASLAAYPLARVARGWSRAAFALFMLGLLVPFQLGLLPLYSTFRELHLLGTHIPLIVFYIGLEMPFAVFLYSQFLREIPIEYEEAAKLDGCGSVRAFVRVIFPLLRPVTGTVVILTAITVWNDFFSPLLYLSGTRLQTIPVSLYSFVGQHGSEWNLIFAGLIIGALPILIAFFLMQKKVLTGFASGLKG